MASKQLAAQIAPRELWIAASELGLENPTKPEIAKCCVLVASGMSPQEACEEVMAMRKTPGTSKTESVFAVKMPEEWIEAVKAIYPDLTDSQLLRFCIARPGTRDDEEARNVAIKKRGRPRKQSAA